MLTIKLYLSFVKAESAISIRLFKRLVLPSWFRACSTLTTSTSWRRQLTNTTISPSFKLTYDQRYCASSYPWNENVEFSGNRLNITQEVASNQEKEHAYACTYDEDYDKDNLHMTPNSVTNQDREQLAELDMTPPDVLRPGIAEFGSATYHDDDEISFDSSQGFEEMEEDWEILHTKQTGLNAALDEVLDNVDDC